MTDMRRTLLWVVFSMSLVLLWDAWSKHNGQPSLFGPQPVSTAPAAAAGLGQYPGRRARRRQPGHCRSCGSRLRHRRRRRRARRHPDRPGEGHARQRPAARWFASNVLTQHEQLQKDLWQKAQELVRPGTASHVRRAVREEAMSSLFDQNAHRLYVAATGLIPATGGSGLPNHNTVMHLVPGERTLKDGSGRTPGEVRVAGAQWREAGQDLHAGKRGDYSGRRAQRGGHQ